MSASFLSVNPELSRPALALTERQRALQVPPLMNEIVSEARGKFSTEPGAQAGPILLDNIEILFNTHLKQDPLPLLQGLSRTTALVVAWSGTLVGHYLTYAVAGHPEYRRYPATDFLWVDLSGPRESETVAT